METFGSRGSADGRAALALRLSRPADTDSAQDTSPAAATRPIGDGSEPAAQTEPESIADHRRAVRGGDAIVSNGTDAPPRADSNSLLDAGDAARLPAVDDEQDTGSDNGRPPARLGTRRAIADNFAALEVLDRLARSGLEPSAFERLALARWHGWGAAAQLFDRPEYAPDRERLRSLLGPGGYDAAARTTLNAHYTDPRLVEAIWRAVGNLGVEFRRGRSNRAVGAASFSRPRQLASPGSGSSSTRRPPR